MKNIIVDSSVVVKWYFRKNEKYRNKALDIIDAHIMETIQLISPELMLYEFINIILISKKTAQADALRLTEKLLNLGMDIVPNSYKLLEKTISATYKYKISAHDASFLALAEVKNGIMVTADDRLVKKVSSIHITHISEVEL